MEQRNAPIKQARPAARGKGMLRLLRRTRRNSESPQPSYTPELQRKFADLDGVERLSRSHGASPEAGVNKPSKRRTSPPKLTRLNTNPVLSSVAASSSEASPESGIPPIEPARQSSAARLVVPASFLPGLGTPQEAAARARQAALAAQAAAQVMASAARAPDLNQPHLSSRTAPLRHSEASDRSSGYEERLRDPRQQAESGFQLVLPPTSPRKFVHSSLYEDEDEDDLDYDGSDVDSDGFEDLKNGGGYALVTARTSHMSSADDPRASHISGPRPPSGQSDPVYDLATSVNSRPSHPTGNEHLARNLHTHAKPAIARSDGFSRLSIAQRPGQRRSLGPSGPGLSRRDSMPVHGNLIKRLQSVLTKQTKATARLPRADYLHAADDDDNAEAHRLDTLAKSALAHAAYSAPITRRDVPVSLEQSRRFPDRTACTNLVEILAWQCEQNPKGTALHVLAATGHASMALTWTNLHARARKIGEALLQADSPSDPDAAILLLFKASSARCVFHFWEALLGCLAAGITAIPLLLAEDDSSWRNAERLQNMLRMCNVYKVACNKETLKSLSSAGRAAVERLDVLRLDTLPSIDKSRQHPLFAGQLHANALVLPIFDASNNCLPLCVTHGSLLHHLGAAEKALGYQCTHSIFSALLPTTYGFLWHGLLAFFAGASHTVVVAGATIHMASALLAALAKQRHLSEARAVYVDHAVFDAMGEYELETATRKANLHDAAWFGIVAPQAHSPSLRGNIAHLRNLGLAQEVVYLVSCSDLVGFVAVASYDAVASTQANVDPELLARGVVAEAAQRSPTSNLLGAGMPLPGSAFVVLDLEHPSPSRMGEIGEIAVRHTLAVATGWAGPLGDKAQGDFDFVLDEDRNERKSKTYTRTGLYGTVLQGQGEQLFIVGDRETLLHVEQTWVLADQVKSSLAAIAKSHARTSRLTAAQMNLVYFSVRRKQLAILISLERQESEDMQLLDSLLSNMLLEVTRRHRVAPVLIGLIQDSDLPTTGLGSVDLPLVTHLLERGQLPLWHLVLDPHAVPSARSRRPTRFAQTPLTQMAGQDLRHSEATGVQLHLSDAVQAARTAMSLLVKLAAKDGSSPSRNLYRIWDDHQQVKALSASDLLSYIRRTAETLNKKGLGKGDRAILMLPMSAAKVAAFHACLLLGVIPITMPFVYDSSQLARWLDVLREVSRNANATFVLTSDKGVKQLRKADRDIRRTLGIKSMISLSKLSPREHYGIVVPHSRAETAYVEYTISNTGVLSGVEFSHQHMLTIGQAITSHYDLESASRVLVNADASTGVAHAWLYYVPLFSAKAEFLCVDPQTLEAPQQWLELASREQVDTALVDYRALMSCLESIEDERVASAINACDCTRLVRCLVVTQERPWQTVLENFRRLTSATGMPSTALQTVLENRINPFLAGTMGGKEPNQPVYVDARLLQEDKLQILAKGSPMGVPIFPLGRLAPAVQAVVVNTKTEAKCTADGIGELWFSSVNNIRSFVGLTDSEVQAQVQHELLERQVTGHDSTYARSGLLGFLHEHRVYVTGHLEDCLLVDDRRFNPLDLEEAVERCHPSLTLGTCVVWHTPASGLVVAVEENEPGRGLALAPLVMRALLEKHDLQVDAIVVLESNVIPIEARGRKQRAALRRQLMDGTMQSHAIIMCNAPAVQL